MTLTTGVYGSSTGERVSFLVFPHRYFAPKSARKSKFGQR